MRLSGLGVPCGWEVGPSPPHTSACHKVPGRAHPARASPPRLAAACSRPALPPTLPLRCCLHACRVPLYSLLRVAGLAWLALPQFQGAKLAYKAVRPFLFVRGTCLPPARQRACGGCVGVGGWVACGEGGAQPGRGVRLMGRRILGHGSSWHKTEEGGGSGLPHCLCFADARRFRLHPFTGPIQHGHEGAGRCEPSAPLHSTRTTPTAPHCFTAGCSGEEQGDPSPRALPALLPARVLQQGVMVQAC